MMAGGTLLLYVNAPEEEVRAMADDGFFDLPTPGSHAFMVMRVARETGSKACKVSAPFLK